MVRSSWPISSPSPCVKGSSATSSDLADELRQHQRHGRCQEQVGVSEGHSNIVIHSSVAGSHSLQLQQQRSRCRMRCRRIGETTLASGKRRGRCQFLWRERLDRCRRRRLGRGYG
jgi:hypothetical protein